MAINWILVYLVWFLGNMKTSKEELLEEVENMAIDSVLKEIIIDGIKNADEDKDREWLKALRDLINSE